MSLVAVWWQWDCKRYKGTGIIPCQVTGGMLWKYIPYVGHGFVFFKRCTCIDHIRLKDKRSYWSNCCLVLELAHMSELGACHLNPNKVSANLLIYNGVLVQPAGIRGFNYFKAKPCFQGVIACFAWEPSKRDRRRSAVLEQQSIQTLEMQNVSPS
jgi:hypothetical protein